MSRRYGRNQRRIVFIAMLILAGCAKRELPGPVDPEMKSRGIGIYTDGETGCQYIGLYERAVTPRIAADGKNHMGCKAVRP